MPIFDDNSLSIGNTPLVRLNRLTQGLGATVAVKTEGRNPAYSVKCRIGAAMIWAAEKDGILKTGSRDRTIVEPTSGNTGIALAFVAAARGYPLVLTMPETMSIERRRMLRAFGAEVVLTEGAKGMAGAIEAAEEMVATRPGAGTSCRSSSRTRRTRRSTSRRPGRRSGATPTARSTSSSPASGRAAPSPAPPASSRGRGGSSTPWRWSRSASPVLTQIRNGEPVKPGPHKIQGIGAGFKPDVLDLSLVDEVVDRLQRGGDRDRDAAPPRGGDNVWNLLGRGGRGRPQGRGAPGEQGEADRRDPARTRASATCRARSSRGFRVSPWRFRPARGYVARPFRSRPVLAGGPAGGS